MKFDRTLISLFLLSLVWCTGCRGQSESVSEERIEPRRIVSLLPSATELVFAVGEGEKVVGVTLNDDYPPEVTKLPKVGDQTVDLEKVLALEPDLVILDSGFNQNKASLERLGLDVLELHCKRLEDVPQALRTIGEALNCEEQANAEAHEFERLLAEVEPLKSDLSVFVEIWGEPLMTVGSATLITDILELLAIENVYSDQEGYFQVDPEDMLSRRPKVILFPTVAADQERSRALLLSERVGSNPSLVTIDPDLLIRPGPRLLEGIQILRKKLTEI